MMWQIKRLLASTAILALAALVGCTDDQGATRVLAAQGMTAIEMTGDRFWMCGRDDVYATGFRAKTPAGVTVTGAVCSGWMKGNTIRFD